MPSDLTVPRVGAVPHIGPQPVAAEAPRGATARAQDAIVPAAGKALPNPTLRLDPGLAIVVIEFRDEAGAVRSTIPTEQQLDAYRTWERGHIGPKPAGSPTAEARPAPVATPPPAGSQTPPAAPSLVHAGGHPGGHGGAPPGPSAGGGGIKHS